jgi:hypothetical protein
MLGYLSVLQLEICSYYWIELGKKVGGVGIAVASSHESTFGAGTWDLWGKRAELGMVVGRRVGGRAPPESVTSLSRIPKIWEDVDGGEGL